VPQPVSYLCDRASECHRDRYWKRVGKNLFPVGYSELKMQNRRAVEFMGIGWHVSQLVAYRWKSLTDSAFSAASCTIDLPSFPYSVGLKIFHLRLVSS
jgi:hypothetical protein